MRRWSSTYNIITPYQELKNCLSSLEYDEIDEMSLSSAENRQIDALMEQLEPLESLKNIAEGNTTVTDIRI